MTMFLVWASLAACVIVIGIAGFRLSYYADIIAGRLGWSRAWGGMVLLATVTSLPELATGISAVSLADAPNIALGDVLGSCVFNLVILAFLDFLYRGGSFYSDASQGHVLSAGLGIILTSIVGINILLTKAGIGYQWGHVGAYSGLILGFYALSARLVFQYERAQMVQYIQKRAEETPTLPWPRAVRGYVLVAGVIVIAGLALPFIGKALAETMGWHTTFTGTLFIAFATSVPELAVTLAALRIGALDMAIANVLGSNLFDLLIVAIDDLFYRDGPLLARVSQLHVITAMFVVLMNGLFIVGLVYRAKTKVFKVAGWASVALMTLYLLNSYIVYLHRE
ncbi:MAG: sodium:calcium antiporter [Gammaproteobacteria bacterium]|nr:sodium:calcium antiporter [Gammaproteobacteria bacterium]